MSTRSILVGFAALLPPGSFKNFVLRRLGWKIGEDVTVWPCLVLGLDKVILGDGTIIGPFNVLRNLTEIELHAGAQLGQWNFITASRHMLNGGAPGFLKIGAQSAVTSRHYIDCTGGVNIGTFTTVAGERSTFITHGISWSSSDQTFDTITIGDFCLISSNVQITPGSRIGNRVVVGMGATVAGDLTAPGLYLQPRAVLVKSDLHGEYFDRAIGSVDSVRPRL